MARNRFSIHGQGDRRRFFNDAVGEWTERLMDRAERKVVRENYLRPPGALPEVGFLAACTRCGDCVKACPPSAIKEVPTNGGLAAGTPYIDPLRQACAVCADIPCAAACPTEALTVPPDGWSHYRLGLLEFVPENCLTYKGMPCTVCLGACPVGEAALTGDEAGHPVLRVEGCVGCGMCLQSCVSTPKSFTLTPLKER